jgi:hypothetical protein
MCRGPRVDTGRHGCAHHAYTADQHPRRESAWQHCGCPELQRRLVHLRPRIHCFGHIHASGGTLDLRGTTFVNPSMVDSRYRIARRPYEFDFLANPETHYAAAIALTSRPTSARTFGNSLLKSASGRSSTDDSGSRALLPGPPSPPINHLSQKFSQCAAWGDARRCTRSLCIQRAAREADHTTCPLVP